MTELQSWHSLILLAKRDVQSSSLPVQINQMEHVRSLRDWTLTLPRPIGICQQCHHYLCDRLTKKKIFASWSLLLQVILRSLPFKSEIHSIIIAKNASYYYKMCFVNKSSMITWSNSTANSHFIHSVKKNPAFGKNKLILLSDITVYSSSSVWNSHHRNPPYLDILLVSRTDCFPAQPLSLAEEMPHQHFL